MKTFSATLLLALSLVLPAAAAEEPKPETLDNLNVPDVAVIDQDGQAKRFYTDLVKDRVVAVNFVFTTCRTICPPMGANFGKLQQLLGERAGKDVHLISVSVDPATDTPERLKAWSQKFGAGPGWTLVTGDRAEITRLLKSLGVYTANIGDHSPLVLIGNDARHRWTRAYGLAAPAKLAELIDGMAVPAAAAKGSQP
jgi:protein SCO1